MRNKLIYDQVKTCKISCLKNGMVVLGLATSNHEENCRYVFTPILSGLRWPGQTVMGSWPPALFRKGEDGRKKKGEKFYICLDVTHTHPARAGSTLKGKRKKKADTRRAGRRPKTAQGGEGNRRTSGTNLHGETDLTKTAHTPKPHDTLRRGTRGKLGTKWGTSWWQTRKPKQLVKQQDSAPKP